MTNNDDTRNLPGAAIGSNLTVYSPSEVASVLKLSVRVVYRLIARGDIKALRVGRQLRITSATLAHLLQSAGDESPAGNGGSLQ